MALDLLRAFEFEAADTALDVIKDVGPRGHFLAQKHARKRIREFRPSPLLRQKGPDGNAQDPHEVVLQEFRWLDETHQPKPLPPEVLAELNCIVAAAEREAERLARPCHKAVQGMRRVIAIRNSQKARKSRRNQ